MLIFKVSEGTKISVEEIERWKDYIECHCEKVVVLPPFIDFIYDTESENFTEREEVEIEEE